MWLKGKKLKLSLYKPGQALTVPHRLPEFLNKVAQLPALRTVRLYPSGDTPGTHFCQRVSRPQGHRAAGRNKAMRNPSDPNGNRARDLPACSALPQPNTPLCALSSVTGNCKEIVVACIKTLQLRITNWVKGTYFNLDKQIRNCSRYFQIAGRFGDEVLTSSAS